MSTQAQIAHTSFEGMTHSSANAKTVSCHSPYAVLLTEEDHQVFSALRFAFRLELHPAGPVELALFHQIVLAAWNIERANRLEADLAAADGIDPLLSDGNAKTLHRIATFRMRAERTFHKCLKELQVYQAAHPLEEPVFQGKSQNEAKNKMKNEPKVVEFKFKREPFVRPTPKIGRNELCSCHSGRKYKNCCLRNEPNPAIPAASPAVQAIKSCTGTL